MSIITGRGDDGTTSLLMGFNTRKGSPLIGLLGEIQILLAHLALARQHALPKGLPELEAQFDAVTRDLECFMGQLVACGDPEYQRRGYPEVPAERAETYTTWCRAWEAGLPRQTSWIHPGKISLYAAQVALASAQARHIEHLYRAFLDEGHTRTLIWKGEGEQQTYPASAFIPSHGVFLNRLCDLIFIWQRL